MSNLTDLIKKALRDQIGDEIIDGTKLDDVVPMVDLGIENTPVVEFRCDDYERDPPKPVTVDKYDDGRFALVWPKEHDFKIVTPDALKVMRARFLLLKGYYYRQLRNMPHPTRQDVVAWYFGGAVWQPQEGSALSKAMGLE